MRFLFLAVAAVCAVSAQEPVLTLPKVGVIDFYGLREVRAPLVTQAMGIRPGTPLPDSKLDIEGRINEIDRVVASRVEAVCCDENGDVVLYAGIEERGALGYDTRTPPGGADTLSDNLFGIYQTLSEAQSRGTDTSAIGASLPDLANRNRDQLRKVLRESSNEVHRAAAALLLSYATPPADIVSDLEYALHDADPGVRAVAVNRLAEFAQLGRRDPSTRIRVPTAWFVDMLNSLAWTDRMAAARALVALTEQGDPATMAQLRSRAMDALIEMAVWKTPEHARPAYILLGRMAGLPDAEISESFDSGERERVIAAARGQR